MSARSPSSGDGRALTPPRRHPPDKLGLIDLPEISDLLLGLGRIRLRVASRSMVPTLRPGDEIMVEPVAAGAIRIGNPILFRHEGQLICHRVIEVSPDGLLTRGDAGGSAGKWIDECEVLGKVVGVRRRSVWIGLKEALRGRFGAALVRLFPHLQRLRAYRFFVSPLVTPFLSYRIGVARGTRWHEWRELSREDRVPVLPSTPRSHLVIAKHGERVAGWVRLEPEAASWRPDEVYVRLRYRGLGLESDLLRWANIACSQSNGEKLAAQMAGSGIR